MQLLVDTHAFLWWVNDSPELSRRARSAISRASNDCLISLASCWEMAIKATRGKLTLTVGIERFLPEQMAINGFRELPIELRHVVRVARLPFHHHDPFDRLLAAQCLEEDLAIVSRDAVFRRYGVKRVW